MAAGRFFDQEYSEEHEEEVEEDHGPADREPPFFSIGKTQRS